VIPYPTHEDAELVRKVITVDRELKPHEVRKEWSVEDAPQATASSDTAPVGTGAGAILKIMIHAATTRSMRLNVNAVLEDIALITRSIAAFDPERMQRAANEGLELGSVGRAG
ncbi:hypothetical protein K437DRAFT_220232, partial [Tilletiaria anomala UBC 951]